MGQGAALRFGRIDQHVEDDGRAAKVRDALVRDGIEDCARLDPAQADAGPAHRGQGPGKAPSVAVEHRQCPQIDGQLREAPGQDVAQDQQIGPAVMIDNALRVTGCAGGVAKGDGIPFIGR